MDRSTTPRASQQQPGGRRSKNRSRSGSEELSQIVAQASAAARAPLANGFWPLSDHVSPSLRPQSATPTPQSVYRAAGAPTTDGDQARATSPPGLLGWVRNAFLQGPSGRTLANRIDEDGEHIEPDVLQNRNDDPIRRNQTPLLPGILPSFHHIGRQTTLEPAIEVPASQRSSLLLDGDEFSVSTHDSLEPYDRSARRASSASTASTASTFDSHRGGDEGSDNSDNDEDVYAPFSQRQPAPAPQPTAGGPPVLVRPTARREPLGFGTPLELDLDKAEPSASTTTTPPPPFTRTSILRGTRNEAGAQHHALSISEAQDTGEFIIVNDTTEPRTGMPDLVISNYSVVAAAQPVDHALDSRHKRNTTADKASLSPIAGWIDVDGSNVNTPRPSSRNESATVSIHTSEPTHDDGQQHDASFGQRVNGAFANQTARQDGSGGGVDGDDAVALRGLSADGISAAGDGEELSDMLGQPKSPEELLQNRQSRESVVLGSRGASVRAGQVPLAMYNERRSRAASASKKRIEGDQVGSRLRSISDMTEYVPRDLDIQATTESNTASNLPAASLMRRRSSAASTPTSGAFMNQSPRPSTSSSHAGERPKQSDDHLARRDSSAGVASPSHSTPRPRGALGFLARRREVLDPAASRKQDRRHTRTTSLTVGAESPSNVVTAATKKDGLLTSPFWRLGRKSQSKAINSIEGQDNKPLSDTPATPKRASFTGGRSDSMCKRASIHSFAAGSTTCAAMHAAPSDPITKRKCIRGALGPSMKPRQIRVRSRNKHSKDREFSAMYLTQELFLGQSSPTPPTVVPKRNVASTSPSTKTQQLPEVQPRNRSPPQLTTNNDSGVGDGGGASNDGHAVPASATSPTAGGASSRRRATWAMRFSLDGKYLAVAGQDTVIRIYAVLDSPDARQHALGETGGEGTHAEAGTSAEAVEPLQERSNTFSSTTQSSAHGVTDKTTLSDQQSTPSSGGDGERLFVFSPEPVREFRGHTSDVLDLSWSKGGFLLSASMDKTARVWHLTRPSSLVAFVHGDFVTSAVFHPRDDRFFLSGSLDGKVRLWNISTKKVHASQEVPGLITACAFTHSGRHVCVGTFSGAALFYQTDDLSFVSSVAVRSTSGSGGGGNAKHQKGGRKVTAIEPIMPDTATTGEQYASSSANDRRGERVLITSNDSRVRAYDLSTQSFVVRFKAKSYTNRTSQIRATLSDDNAFIIAGSEAASSSDGGQVHIWACSATLFDATTKSLLSKLATGSMNAMVAANQRTSSLLRSSNASKRASGASVATVDSAGSKNKSKAAANGRPASTILEDSVEYFTAHASTVTCAIMAPRGTNRLLRQANDPILLRSEAVLQTRLASNVGGSLSGLAEALVSLPLYLGKTMYTTLFTPLRSTNTGNSNPPMRMPSALTDEKSAVQHHDAAVCLNDRLNHILVSVDDNAVVRVWRSDNLDTMAA